MSEQQEDLELQALQRQLDGAFETTRPRAGFEDELWARMQEARPVPSRLRDALAGLVRGIREIPAVPLAGVAALLVVVLGVGLFAYSGIGRPRNNAPTAQLGNGAAGAAGGALYGPFGKLPTPALASSPRSETSVPNVPSKGAASPEYAGPVQLTWTGQLNVASASEPVFRYQEPTTTTADQFASSLGAVLRSRPGGLLGSYDASDYSLEVRGTVQSPPQSPAYFIYSSPDMPAIDAAGAGPADLAGLFLAEHSLTPDWAYTAAVDSSSNPTRVVLQRQFQAPGYGPAYLVDLSGNPYGMELDLDGSRVVHVSGVLPVSLDNAMYPIISSDAAIRAAIGSGSPVPATATPAPAVVLTKADLAYMLVPAGDHSFYEPVFVFSGTLKVGTQTYAKHVIVPAVDPSLLTR